MKTFALVAALTIVASPALAGSLAKYSCGVIGAPSPEGADKKIVVASFVCHGTEGMVKDAVMTGRSIFDVEKKVYLSGQNVIRSPGGLAVVQMVEGTRTYDGDKWVSSQGKSKSVYASGTFAAMNGKTDSWVAKPDGFNHFTVEVSDEVSN
jgi:hypothetical protein